MSLSEETIQAKQQPIFTSATNAIKTLQSVRDEIARLTKDYMRRNRLKEIETIPIQKTIEIKSETPKQTPPSHIHRERVRVIKKPVPGKSGERFIIQRGEVCRVVIKEKTYGESKDIKVAVKLRDEKLKALGLNEYGWTPEEAALYEVQAKHKKGAEK